MQKGAGQVGSMSALDKLEMGMKFVYGTTSDYNKMDRYRDALIVYCEDEMVDCMEDGMSPESDYIRRLGSVSGTWMRSIIEEETPDKPAGPANGFTYAFAGKPFFFPFPFEA